MVVHWLNIDELFVGGGAFCILLNQGQRYNGFHDEIFEKNLFCFDYFVVSVLLLFYVFFDTSV